MRLYAIGDVHGQLEKLKDIHERIAEDQKEHGPGGVTLHLGDLVDRGPNSAGVIDYLMTGIADGQDWIALKGNHDRLMSFFLEDPLKKDRRLRPEYNWLSKPLGGLATLASYGVDAAEEDPIQEIHEQFAKAVPEAHRDFLHRLPLMHQTDGFVFVHAGIRPGVPFDQQTEDDLVWIRKEFHEDHSDHGAVIVHGHTPVDVVSDYGNRINVDTGAAYGRELSVVVIENGTSLELGPEGRRKIARG